MAVKIGINGFGRIGRLVFRAVLTKKSLDVVHINDLDAPASLAMLLKYDSVHRRFNGTIAVDGNTLVVNNKKIAMSAEKDPSKLPWRAAGVDIVVESTGKFTTRQEIMKHIENGAKKVLLTAPAKDDIDATIVRGVNDHMLKSEHKIVSNASCTTNCLAPMVKVLNDAFGVERGLMTTCHAYTNDQRILDQIHKDLRRARSAAINIIPTTTGAAKAVGLVIPELKGKLNGISLRVPVPDGSVTDLVVVLKKKVTVEDVNAAMKKAAEGPLKGLLEYTEDPIVSSDVIGTSVSCLFDAGSTMVITDTMVKVIGWYDNEWAYSLRCAELLEMMAK